MLIQKVDLYSIDVTTLNNIISQLNSNLSTLNEEDANRVSTFIETSAVNIADEKDLSNLINEGQVLLEL